MLCSGNKTFGYIFTFDLKVIHIPHESVVLGGVVGKLNVNSMYWLLLTVFGKISEGQDEFKKTDFKRNKNSQIQGLVGLEAELLLRSKQ